MGHLERHVGRLASDCVHLPWNHIPLFRAPASRGHSPLCVSQTSAAVSGVRVAARISRVCDGCNADDARAFLHRR